MEQCAHNHHNYVRLDGDNDPFWILLPFASCLTHSEASSRHHLRASYRWAYPRKRSRRSPFGVPRGAWGWGRGFIRRGEARLARSNAQAEHDQECDCFHGNSTLLGTRTRYDRAIKRISSRRTSGSLSHSPPHGPAPLKRPVSRKQSRPWLVISGEGARVGTSCEDGRRYGGRRGGGRRCESAGGARRSPRTKTWCPRANCGRHSSASRSSSGRSARRPWRSRFSRLPATK